MWSNYKWSGESAKDNAHNCTSDDVGQVMQANHHATQSHEHGENVERDAPGKPRGSRIGEDLRQQRGGEERR
jgi:hypothetical protein